MLADDIILAVASPPGRSPRGIIRMSGPGALDLLSATLERSGDQRLRTRGLHRARMQLPDGALPVLALVMPGPRSYTGEDSAELQLPGNPNLLQRVVEFLIASAACAQLPARRAEAGEFTARAFFNNRLSLTQAEGVAATIAAQSDAELKAAGMLRSGAIGDLAHSLADRLASALALVEAGIDFTDQEDVVAISPRDLHDRLTELVLAIQSHLDRAVGLERLEAIPWVVLTGPPNAGKSTLFNAMLGRDRAVVSDVAGTTRDVLAEPLPISTARGQAEVMLVDLAGAEHVDALESRARIEPHMQQAAQEALQRAELILICIPADAPTSDLPWSPPADRPVIRLLTKAELSPGSARSHDLAVSALESHNLEKLREAIADRLADRAVSLAGDLVALTPRHESALRSAGENLREAVELIAPIRNERALAEPELAASSMRAALNDLAGLAGDITPDDVLGRVFTTFCVGK